MVELDTDLIASANCYLTVEFKMGAELIDEMEQIAIRHFPNGSYRWYEDVETGAFGNFAEEAGISVELNEYVIGTRNNRVEVSRLQDMMLDYLRVREEWEIDNLLSGVDEMSVDEAQEYVDGLSDELMRTAKLKTTKPMDLSLEVDSEVYLEVSFVDRAKEDAVNEVVSQEFKGDLVNTYSMDKRTLLIWKSDFGTVLNILKVRDALEQSDSLNVRDASVVCNVHDKDTMRARGN